MSPVLKDDIARIINREQERLDRALFEPREYETIYSKKPIKYTFRKRIWNKIRCTWNSIRYKIAHLIAGDLIEEY